MEWIKFIFKVLFSLTGYYWFVAGYKKRIGPSHSLCFIIACVFPIFKNPISGVAILICIILGIISIIVCNSNK